MGKGLLDTLVEEGICRRIHDIGKVGQASTTGKHADDTIVGVTNDIPRVPRGDIEKAPSLLL